jgi:hypothetical protein
MKGLLTQRLRGAGYLHPVHFLQPTMYRLIPRLRQPLLRVRVSYRSVYDKDSLGEWTRLLMRRRKGAQQHPR